MSLGAASSSSGAAAFGAAASSNSKKQKFSAQDSKVITNQENTEVKCFDFLSASDQESLTQVAKVKANAIGSTLTFF